MTEGTTGMLRDDVFMHSFPFYPPVPQYFAYPRMDTGAFRFRTHHQEVTDMEVQGIYRSFQIQEPRQDARQTREHRMVAHDALPKVKSPEEAQKLIDEVRHLLLYG